MYPIGSSSKGNNLFFLVLVGEHLNAAPKSKSDESAKSPEDDQGKRMIEGA